MHALEREYSKYEHTTILCQCVAAAAAAAPAAAVSTGKQAILHALEREHSKYEHTTYYPIAVAADDQHNTAFVGVAWEYKNVGPLRSGAQPSNK
jgi:hypothetical protein